MNYVAGFICPKCKEEMFYESGNFYICNECDNVIHRDNTPAHIRIDDNIRRVKELLNSMSEDERQRFIKEIQA